MTTIRCTQCGATELEEGFLADLGRGSRGYGQWISGAVELGVLGFAKMSGRRRLTVRAFRCPACGHLELFA